MISAHSRYHSHQCFSTTSAIPTSAISTRHKLPYTYPPRPLHGRSTRWVSTAAIVIGHVQTLSIVSKLRLAWPQSTQLVSGFYVLSAVSMEEARPVPSRNGLEPFSSCDPRAVKISSCGYSSTACFDFLPAIKFPFPVCP